MSADSLTLEKAKNLWQESIDYRNKNFPANHLNGEYIFHTKGVASAAYKIASKTVYLNPEKAYILGLLHDYGKRIKEKTAKRFHGREGYEVMLEKGYEEVAKICLTHTFPDKNFDAKTFGYPEDWMLWAKKTLQDIEYDDYDRLIQLCDKFYEGKTMVSIESRVNGIIQRYGLSSMQKMRLLSEGRQLKNYFDKLCNDDVYNVLGIRL